MIDDLKPYPAYKESGVPWLGQVPEHWGVRRLKRVANLNPSKAEARTMLSSKVMVTFLPMERVGVDGRINAREIRSISQVWSGFTYFRRSDVIIAKITPCFENGKGACLDELPTEIGFGSTEFHVLRATSSLIPQFLYRVTTIPEFRHLGADAMTGAAGQQRVPQSFVSDFHIGIPPLGEQEAIIRFIDHADRRIRRYIRAKQKLVSLLNEQKQSLIHRAVTRGLDPNVRLKPSGVEWLGEVPEHWQVVALGVAASSIQTGPFGSQLPASAYVNGGTPVINPSHMNDGRIHADPKISVNAEKARELDRHRLQLGDVVAARRGELGRCALVKEPQEGWLCGTGSLRIRLRSEMLFPAFLVQVLSSSKVRAALTRESIGATMDNLNSSKIARLRCPLPPLQEQVAITAYIAEEFSLIDLAVAATIREIDLLREYRTRLIADVVSGKLDVRAAAALLPDEADEPDLLDEAESADEAEEEALEEVEA